MTAALMMLLAGILTLREAYEAIDWPILVLLGAMMPVGHAFEATGAAQLLASQVAIVADWGGVRLVLPVLMVTTMLLSNVVNNAAAAVLMAPIALRLATVLHVSADPLLMGVAIGASAAFLTPIGHQSNTLVMEPGGYQFGDYWRLGLPVSIAVTLAAIPLIWCGWLLSRWLSSWPAGRVVPKKPCGYSSWMRRVEGCCSHTIVCVPVITSLSTSMSKL